MDFNQILCIITFSQREKSRYPQIPIITTTTASTSTTVQTTFDISDIPSFGQWVGAVGDQLPFNFSDIKPEFMLNETGMFIIQKRLGLDFIMFSFAFAQRCSIYYSLFNVTCKFQ